MFKKVFFFLTLCTTATGLCAQEKQRSQPGRYQISTVYNPEWGTEVFLVDTETGSVWKNWRSKRKFMSSDYGEWKELPPLFPSEEEVED
ncbi:MULTISPECIES: hypothetical protein [Parachlamydia]|jgi:hypothetical protein|uniref:Uncharacterized protein n=1 Tax=Parachlamydia acanthamoebae (strain UV7) TaxID=765952 RepID=F8KZ68_PARAV|nr:hypothetical protein [Parachlamydia acanthamoebae]EFB41929.1 hypothetical protein pah_c022o251 [Parachlamydia acanthamoebae str. Hall's coccus]CCB86191.1 putative uncharacterized protein [Parachlamydia acanthamoebae UV-7]